MGKKGKKGKGKKEDGYTIGSAGTAQGLALKFQRIQHWYWRVMSKLRDGSGWATAASARLASTHRTPSIHSGRAAISKSIAIM